MENAGIVLYETVVVANDSCKKLIILRQVRCSSQKPTVPQISLLHIKARVALNKEPRRILGTADIFRSPPLKVTAYLSRVIKALTGRWEFGIFEKLAGVQALLSNCVKILNAELTTRASFLLSELKIEINVQKVVKCREIAEKSNYKIKKSFKL